MSDKFDAIVVGAGPAGSTAALALARDGLSVALLERGEEPGAKNVSGGVLYYSEALNSLLPEFWKEAPVERFVTRQRVTFLSPDSSLSLDFKDTSFAQPPYNGFTVLRAKFDRWYARKAEEAGAILIPETVVDDLLWENGKVVGVATRRSHGEIYGDVVIAADGANSLLARKAGLRQDFSPDCFASAAKEVLELPSAVIEDRFHVTGNEGATETFVGAFAGGLEGGAFLYTNKASLSLGVVARLSALQRHKVSIAALLDSFKGHPCVKGLLQGTVLKEYSGHLIPEYGTNVLPRLYGSGIMVAGDAAGLLSSTGFTQEGMNFAMASGLAAAQALKSAKQSGDFSARGLAGYQARLEKSFVLKDRKTFRRVPDILADPRLYTVYPALACGVARRAFKVDGRPRKKLWNLFRAEAKGKVSLWRLAGDIIRAGRALL